ncbi:MAG: type II secretion system F family protein [Spongiibacter sp.]
MNNWWFDLLAISLLACIGFIALKARQAEISDSDSADANLFEEPQNTRWTLYPQQLIRQSGLVPRDFRSVYWLAKVVPCLLSLLMYTETPEHWRSPWLLGGGQVAAFIGVDLWLLRRRKARREQIGRSLPFFVNVLVVYLKSGLGLTKAFENAAEYGLDRKNALAQEVSLLNLEFEAGRSREEAFDNLARRTGVKELERLAAVLSVGFHVGSPVAETLQSQAELMRVKQAQMGAKLVNRKTMEAMLPMSLVCFPMFVVLIFYPAAAQISDVLSLLKELF